MRDKRRYIIFTVMTVIWMAVIFINSSFDGGESSGLSEMLIGWILKISIVLGEGPKAVAFRDFLNAEVFHIFLRKSAHFMEFGILGMLSYAGAGIIDGLRNSIWIRFASALGFSLLYAISDEVHQLFVPGRCGSAADVLVDFCGAAFFIGIMVLLSRGNRKNKKE